MVRKSVKKFVPEYSTVDKIDIKELSDKFGKKMIYASSGRAAFYHILKSFNLKGTILIPRYICATILEPIKKLKWNILYYDYNENFNFDLNSIQTCIENKKIDVVLVASMYGNPADLKVIEELCRYKKIFLIDDAAQAFGARIENRYVGSFGNAGFFSFSPGKPTAGAMGAFFWSDTEINIKRKRHNLIHRIIWADYFMNRKLIYYKKNKLIGFILEKSSSFIKKKINLYNDNFEQWELEILESIMASNLNELREKRLKCIAELCLYRFENFRVVKGNNYLSNPHKIVLTIPNSNVKDKLCIYLKLKDIYYFEGYFLLDDRTSRPLLIELPLEVYGEGFKMVFDALKEFDNVNNFEQ